MASEGAVEVVGPEAAVARFAARYDGAITRDQLTAIGLSPDAVDYRIECERLHPRHRGVYLLGHNVAAERAPLFAAVLALGDKAYINHRTALEQYGVLEPVDGPVHVTVIGCCRRSRDNIKVHRTTRIAAEDIGTVDGLRITSPARAILDFADDATPRELARAVNEAQVIELVTPDELRALMKRTPGRRGAALLTATLDRHDGPDMANEGGERLLAALLTRARVAKPEINVMFHGYEVDLLYRDENLVIECDSGRFHGTPAAVDRDRRKEAALRAHRCLVLRYSYWQIAEEPEAVLAEIVAERAARSRFA